MVIERRQEVVAQVPGDGRASNVSVPGPYSVVIRIDDRRNAEAVTYIVRKAFGEGVAITERAGGRISARVWIEVGSFPREIAEARADVVRRSANLGRIGVGILIRRAG